MTKSTWGIKSVAALIRLLLFTAGAFAQEGSIRFSHPGIAGGLSQSSVYNILQDSRGIATAEGPHLYNGYSFRHFHDNPGNPYSINSRKGAFLTRCAGNSSLKM